MKQIFKYSLIAGIAFACVLPTHAGAQSRDLVNRLNRLENEVQTLNDAYFRGKTPPSNYQPRTTGGNTSAQVEVRINQLEQQIRALTGQAEQNAYAVQQMQNDLQRALQDLELRLQDMERNRTGYNSGQNNYQVTTNSGAVSGNVQSYGQPTSVVNGRFVPSQQPPQPQLQPQAQPPQEATVASGKTLGSLGNGGSDPVNEYEAAFAALRSGDYGQAEAGFRDFLDNHESHNLASNAQYWLAETYYVRGNYEQAARGFAIGYQKYPKSTKAADNLLKLGLSLANSGKKDDACLTFKQLEEAFPNAQTPLKRRVSQEKGRLGC